MALALTLLRNWPCWLAKVWSGLCSLSSGAAELCCVPQDGVRVLARTLADLAGGSWRREEEDDEDDEL